MAGLITILTPRIILTVSIASQVIGGVQRNGRAVLTSVDRSVRLTVSSCGGEIWWFRKFLYHMVIQSHVIDVWSPVLLDSDLLYIAIKSSSCLNYIVSRFIIDVSKWSQVAKLPVINLDVDRSCVLKVFSSISHWNVMPLCVIIVLNKMVDFIKFSHKMHPKLRVWHTQSIHYHASGANFMKNLADFFSHHWIEKWIKIFLNPCLNSKVVRML